MCLVITYIHLYMLFCVVSDVDSKLKQVSCFQYTTNIVYGCKYVSK